MPARCTEGQGQSRGPLAESAPGPVRCERTLGSTPAGLVGALGQWDSVPSHPPGTPESKATGEEATCSSRPSVWLLRVTSVGVPVRTPRRLPGAGGVLLSPLSAGRAGVQARGRVSGRVCGCGAGAEVCSSHTPSTGYRTSPGGAPKPSPRRLGQSQALNHWDPFKPPHPPEAL